MGRIRTKLVKRTGQRLVKENPELFKQDFEHNKKTLITKVDVPSKKLRNFIAGYITKLSKESK